MTLTKACGDQDRHQAPALPHIYPLSLQQGGGVCFDSPLRLSKFIRSSERFPRKDGDRPKMCIDNVSFLPYT